MVGKIARFFTREFQTVESAAILLGFFSVSSQIFALVRDRLLAHMLGAGTTLDIYYAAFRVPDLIYIFISSLVSAAVLIPYIQQKTREGGEKSSKEFLSGLTTLFSVTIIVADIVAFVALPYLSKFLVPGFSLSAQESFVSVSRVLLLSPLLLGFSNLIGSVSQANRLFLPFAIAPVLYNIGIIGGVLFLYPHFGVVGLAWGVIGGALLHVLVQIPGVLVQHNFPVLGKIKNIVEYKQVVMISFFRVVSLSLQQFVLILLIGFATHIMEGGVTIFTFAYNLQSVFLSAIGISLSVAAYPTLTRHFASKDMESYREHFLSALKALFFFSLPGMVYMIVLRAHMVRAVLGSGMFNWTDTRLTAAALALFAVSITFQCAMLLFIRALYALGKTKLPLQGSFVTLLTTGLSLIGLDYYFTHTPEAFMVVKTLLRVSDIGEAGVLVLPIAFSVGMIVGTIVLFMLLNREITLTRIERKSIRRSFFDHLGASLLSGFVAYQALIVAVGFFKVTTLATLVLQGAISVIVGLLVHVLMLVLLENEEFKNFTNAVKSKLKIVRTVVIPEQTTTL